MLVGAVAEHVDITERQLNLLASADLSGFFVAATASAFFARKINWRWVSIGLLVLMVGLNFLSIAYKDQVNTFLVLRFLNGLTQGGLAGIFAAYLSDTLLPERNYAIFFALQTMVAAALLYLLPSYIAELKSPAPVLHVQTILAFIAIIMVLLFLPQKGLDRTSETIASSTTGILLPLIGVIGLLLFYITQGGTWAFIERIGNSFGLEAGFVGKALSISMASSFAGSMLATLTGLKWGKKVPLILTLIGQPFALWLLFSGTGSNTFLIAICTFSFFWAYSVPYLFGILIDIDKSGRTILFSNPIFALGVSLAPVILSFFISEQDYSPIGYLSTISIVGSLSLFFYLLKKNKLTG
jgi:hypothetical protein